jgi:hypothetical protein
MLRASTPSIIKALHEVDTRCLTRQGKSTKNLFAIESGPTTINRAQETTLEARRHKQAMSINHSLETMVIFAAQRLERWWSHRPQ